MYSLENLEKMARLIHDVQRVKRIARRPNEKELTNTAEHTFELAMMCWYIASVHKLNLDLGKIFQYALAHDVIEAYAGDTPMFDEEAKKTKAEREAQALQKIEREFPEFSDLTKTIHEYEKREALEAKFVYAVDKIVDPLDLSMEEADSMWKEYNISLETVKQNKDHKIALSPDVVPYWELLLEKLKDKHDFFFHE